MSAVAVGLGLAILASIALNAGFLLQHVGARGTVAISAHRPVATMRSLLRSPSWALGGALGLAGWALHVGALGRAPLSLVQAFAAGGLAVAALGATRVRHVSLDRRELRAIGLMGLALVALSLGLVPARATPTPPVGMVIFLATSGLLAGVLGATVTGGRRALGLGAAGGILYGAADAATKAVTTDAHGTALGALSSPWLPVVLLASAGAFFCFQRALQIGAAVPVIALMTAATNVVAILGGLIVFGDVLGATPGLAALHAGALILIGVAAYGLAPAPARLTDEADPPPVSAEGEPALGTVTADAR